MKKTFIILLALVMALSLVACGGNDDKKTESKDEQSVAASTDAASKEESKPVAEESKPVAEESTPAEESKEESKEESAPVEESKEESTPVVVVPDIERGTVEGNVYTNASTGLSFTAPEGWYFATNEELAEEAGVDVDTYTGDFATLLAENETVYDVMAACDEPACGIMVGYENLALSEGGVHTEEEYIEHLMEGYTAEGGAEMGIEVSVKDDVTLGGNTYKVVEVNVADAMITSVCLRKIDSFMVLVAVVSDGTVATEDVLALFA